MSMRGSGLREGRGRQRDDTGAEQKHLQNMKLGHDGSPFKEHATER